MSALGIHLRAGTVVAARWPRGAAPVLFDGRVTYRGDHVRLGVPDEPEPSDVVLSGLDEEAFRTYVALLTREVAPAAGPVVVAVPVALQGSLAAPGVRVVAAPIALVAYAHATGALQQAPVAAPTLVCVIDDRGAEVTVLHAVPHVIRLGATTPIVAPAGIADRAGVIGAEVAAAARAAGLADEPIRLLVSGEAEPESGPGLAGEVASAAQYRSREAVHLIRLPDARAAIAAGAAAIGAGHVVTEDRFRYGVSLSGHVADFDRLDERWPELAAPDTITTGQHGPALEMDVDGGPAAARVRLTGSEGDGRDVEVPMDPPLPAGTYEVSFTITEDGPALHFAQPGTSAVFLIPSGGR
ncbi:hypothetical protein [Paractinoplanes maris]|uniref:hypothetical protein n=1 Tax=Paractinoplanes maris TaxID=1734446 RepID=UPI0020229A57|nr:hypothetical protein [Actinoplanes maris]